MSQEDILDQELLEDINSTEKELDAYYNIYKGYRVLASLSENIKTGKSNLYHIDYEYFLQLFNECSEFLIELKKIKEDRGLE
jgi:hypothetical protein